MTGTGLGEVLSGPRYVESLPFLVLTLWSNTRRFGTVDVDPSTFTCVTTEGFLVSSDKTQSFTPLSLGD